MESKEKWILVHNFTLSVFTILISLAMVVGSCYLVQVYDWSAWVIFFAVICSPSTTSKKDGKKAKKKLAIAIEELKMLADHAPFCQCMDGKGLAAEALKKIEAVE